MLECFGFDSVFNQATDDRPLTWIDFRVELRQGNGVTEIPLGSYLLGDPAQGEFAEIIRASLVVLHS